MPLSAACIVPHSPLLLPTVGKDYARQIKKIKKSLDLIEQELYAAHPDIILIIHPHGQPLDETFRANVGENLNADFKEFGDLVTTGQWPGALGLAQQLRQRSDHSGFPLAFTHQPNISYDAAVPMMTVGQRIKPVSILPISPANLDPQTHVNFGRIIAETLHQLQSRIAVIASVELSQHTSQAAPGGIRTEGAIFDQAIVRGLGTKHWERSLLEMDPYLIELAESCGYRPLLILSGILMNRNRHAKKLGYDHPFGIGLLTAFFHNA